MKRLFAALILFFAGTIVVTPKVHAQGFPDVDSSHPNYDAIIYAQENGIVSGFTDGTFKPDRQISRAEYTKIIVNYLFPDDVVYCTSNYFPDVTGDALNSFGGFICVAKEYSIVNGFTDGTYRPYQSITSAEGMKIISNGFNFTSYATVVDPEKPFKVYIDKLAEKNAIPTTIIGLNKEMTRGEMVEIIYRIKNNITTRPFTNYENITTANISNLPISHNRFGINVFKELYAQEPSKNIFISPSSIELALSMTYNGASSETKQAMAHTLNLWEYDIEDVNQASKNLIDNLVNSSSDVELTIANSIWAKQEIPFNDQFLQTNEIYYNADVNNVDFSDPNTVNLINDWVNQQTQGKITEIVQSPIDPYKIMYLINAIYFKAEWSSKFNEYATAPDTFYNIDGGSTQQDIMHNEGYYNYLENNEFQAIKIPYKSGGRWSMYVFMPKDSFQEFINSTNSSKIDKWIDEFEYLYGSLELPKYTLEYEKGLKDVLTTLGMGIAFQPGVANFSNMNNQIDIQIDEVKHKTYIEVNEDGTIAAAVTSVGVGTTSMPPAPQFHMNVNRPFFYIIRDDETKTVMFTGAVVKLN
ncbi:hypothetical protein GF362_04195 [Candidatus Dojkabacteria bacterium]|nr:hypothetical protein [Candidatus Dojkabacteria bacterium]